MLFREAAEGRAAISFEDSTSENPQQTLPIAKVTMPITMEHGSNVESRLHSLWSDTTFELQMFLFDSAQRQLGFTFNRLEPPQSSNDVPAQLHCSNSTSVSARSEQ